MGSKSFGPGVSGYLNPDGRAWETTVFQAGKPVLDKELNLQQDIDVGAGQLALTLALPSGWLSADFLGTSVMPSGIYLSSAVANQYHLPGLVAHVNGWVIPVRNTGKNDGTNAIDLKPGPIGAGTKETALVVLEVWRRLISPASDGTGKSASGRIWNGGNVKIASADDAGLNFLDDIKDTALGAESTKRVQVQYRLRVLSGVDLFAHPYGLDDPSVVANSVPTNPTTPDGAATVFAYTNQGAAGDPGLWRAGDGIPTNTLGTVDGYMYAIPLSAVFRRNRTAYNRNSNQNGGVASPGPSDRPDGLFSDIVDGRDVADLRHGVSPSGWDYEEVLQKNLGYLLDNKLQTEWMNALQGGGSSGHTILMADEIGVSNANGGDGVTTGDTPAGTLIGEFDATRRSFSDRAIYETVVVKVSAPGGGWTTGSVVTLNPTALAVYPYAAFNWAAYNPADVLFLDVVGGWWVGTAGKKTYPLAAFLVTGLGTIPVSSVAVTIGDVSTYGLTDEDLYVTLLVAYPRGEGLSMTPTGSYAGSISVNNPGQLPAGAPVNYQAMAPSNAVESAHREVQVQYVTSNQMTAVLAADSLTTGATSFFVPERVQTIVSVSRNGSPIGGGTIIGPDGRTVSFTSAGDYTSPGDTLQVTYTALRPLPQNGEQITVYYEARAPQTLRSSVLGTSIRLIPRAIGKEVYALTTGSGSEDEAYPYPTAYTQVGGIYPTSTGTFNGDYELAASADLSVATFNATSGFMKLPLFVGYTPAPEEVVFNRGSGDTDIEGRSYFKTVPGGTYVPSGFAQPLSDAKRHRNFLPVLAEVVGSTQVGPGGLLVLVLLVREAIFDALNGVSFEPLSSNTTTAGVFHLKGRLLNSKGA